MPRRVIHGDYDNALLGQSLAIVNRDRAGALGVAAAVDEHVNRPLLAGALRSGPHVQEKAVFTDIRMRHELVSPRLALGDDVLDAARAELIGFLHTLPFDNCIGRAPAQAAYRRRREWHALEYGDGGVLPGNTRYSSA
jgi:hypothetical protein